MALADRQTKPDTRTRFEKWLDSLNDKNRATVDSWLRDPAIPNSRIAEWIREDDEEDDFSGYSANKDTISLWRAKHGVA